MSPSSRKTYESPRQRARRAAILDTTREILAKNGYDGTTIRDIASQAGVAKGTLYNIYGGKDGLILSAIVDVREDIGERALDAGPSRGLGRVLATDRAMIEQIVESPTYAEAVARAIFGAQAGTLLVPILMDVPVEAQERFLEDAKRMGEIHPDTDTSAVARQLVMQSWGMLMALTLGRLSPDELPNFAGAAIVRVLGSIATPEGAKLLDRHLDRHR